MSVYTTVLNEFTIYVGSVFFSTGVLGNLLNAIVFYKNNFQNPSTFLLFLASCFNFVYIFIGLLSRLLAARLNIDMAFNNLAWCKIRFYLLQLYSLCSVSCICYAIIDQFFASSQYERWHRLNKISITRRVVCILISFWILYSIPLLIFSGLVRLSSDTIACIFVNNLGFSRFASYFNLPIVWGITPITVLTVFGCLTYRNVSLLRNHQNRERAQRHLASMILLHVIFIIIGTLPYAFFYTYSALTFHIDKSVDRQDLENFVSNIVAVILYFSYSSSFFVYYFASATFRHQVKTLLHLSKRNGRIKPSGNLELRQLPPKVQEASLIT